MSDIQYQLYTQSVMRLTDSILIKDEAMAVAINADVNLYGGALGISVNPDDLGTWKYYMNLAGEYHVLDTPMQIVSLDTMQTINFDRATLLEHRATLRAYTYSSRYYNELVNKFPNQEFLIRGILNPVNKATAIAAKNYSILRYSTLEVEGNESDLIKKLQAWIDSFVDRWYLPAYGITDTLYPAAVVAAIYVNLPPAIMTIRKENANTYRAHSFHIWNYLESHGRLGKYRDILTTKQKLWLYRNIKWVFVNAGKEYTFEKLMDIILSHRGIPVGYYEHILNTEKINEDIYAAPNMQRTPLNLFESMAPEPVFRSVQYVMEKQIPLARDNGRFYEDNFTEISRKLPRSKLNKMITKVYESEVIDVSEQLPITLPEMLLQHWLYFSTHNRYPSILSVVNPYTSESIRVNTKEAFILWLYAINKTVGVTLDTIPQIEAIYVRRLPLPTKTQLKGIVESRLVPDKLIDRLLDDQVPIGVFTSTEQFYETVNDIHVTFLRHHGLHTGQQHLDKRAQVNAIVDRCYQTVTCELHEELNKSYLSYFAEKGWDFEPFARQDFELFAAEILEKATGADVKSTISLREVQAAMLGIMSQLGTYATQYIQTVDAQPAIILGNLAIRVGNTDVSEASAINHQIQDIEALKLNEKPLELYKMDMGRRYLDLFMTHPTPHEYRKLDPTVRMAASVINNTLFQHHITDVCVSTDLEMELGDTQWALIPDINAIIDVYTKTISPSIELSLSSSELSALEVNQMRLHTTQPGLTGELNELSSFRYKRLTIDLGAVNVDKRFLTQTVKFDLTAADIVSWVSYWHNDTFKFAVPFSSKYYPIDGELVVDQTTTYVGIAYE